MKVLHLPGAGKYILCYGEGIQSFDSLEDRDLFMTGMLGYNNPQLENGYQNIYQPAAQGSSPKQDQ